MKNYNVSDEPVTKVAVDIDDIKDTRREKSLNKECVFLMAGRMIYRKGLESSRIANELLQFDVCSG